MTSPSNDLLVTTEGVDEGSAASTAEGPDTADASPRGAGASSDPRAVGDRPTSGENASTPTPPVDMESEQSREQREATGSGQQLQVGEG